MPAAFALIASRHAAHMACLLLLLHVCRVEAAKGEAKAAQKPRPQATPRPKPRQRHRRQQQGEAKQQQGASGASAAKQQKVTMKTAKAVMMSDGQTKGDIGVVVAIWGESELLALPSGDAGWIW